MIVYLSIPSSKEAPPGQKLFYSSLYPSTIKRHNEHLNNWIYIWTNKRLSDKTGSKSLDHYCFFLCSISPIPWPQVLHGRTLHLRKSMSKPLTATKIIMTCWLQILWHGGHCWEPPDLHPVSHTAFEEEQLRWAGYWLGVSWQLWQPSWHQATPHCPVEGDLLSLCPKNIGSRWGRRPLHDEEFWIQLKVWLSACLPQSLISLVQDQIMLSGKTHRAKL